MVSLDSGVCSYFQSWQVLSEKHFMDEDIET